MDAAGGGDESFVAAEGKDSDGDGGEGAVELEEVASLGLAAGFLGRNFFFLVGVEEEDEGGPIGTAGGFDDVWVVALLGLIIEVGEVLAAVFGVLAEVVVGAVGDAFEFGPAPGEAVLDIVDLLGVVGKLVGLVLAEPEVVGVDAERDEPVHALLGPVLEPVVVGTGFDEELQLHYFKLAGAEGRVAGGNFVAEGLADLGDAEGELAAGGVEDVFEVDVDALGGLGAEVDLRGGVFNGAHESLEHEVELAGVGEFALAVGAFIGIEVVGAESLMADAAFYEGVGEAAEMAAGLPGGGVHEDGGVESNGVVAVLEDGTPPGVLDVSLELGAEGAVVPGGVEAAVDFAALEEEAASLGEGEEFFHGDGLGGCCHVCT